jgi:hypothetical protein
MGKVSDLSNFEHDMIVSVRLARSSISELAFHLGFSYITVSYTNKNHPVSGIPMAKKSMLMRENEGEWQESRKLTGGSHTDK